MAVQLRRLRDFPEVMDAERAAVLDDRVAQPNAMLDSAVLNKAAKALCGATALEIHHWINEASLALSDREERDEVVDEEAWDRAALQDEERRGLVGGDLFDLPRRTDAEILAFYTLIGWDPTNEYGQVLRIAENLTFCCLAAAKSAGPARFPEEGVETARLWAEKMAARPRPRRSGAPAQPISDEERRRRDAEARNSNVWRPVRTGRSR